MIWYYIILFITTLLTEVFSWVPKITTLPNILGVDIDGNLSDAVAYFHAFTSAYWPLQDLMYATLFFVGYLVFKNIVLKVFLGHRAPN